MFNHDFDPLQQLLDLQKQLLQCNNNITQLARNNHQRAELQTQMLEHLNKQTEAINNIDVTITELHNRVRLLEMARQYEQTNEIKN
jgi:hypothetical protein